MDNIVKDTSADYDDMVGYSAEIQADADLSKFLGEDDDSDESDNRPYIKPTNVDPEYPEQWQTIHINFSTFDDYVAFMQKLGKQPLAKLKPMIYQRNEDQGVAAFFGD